MKRTLLTLILLSGAAYAQTKPVNQDSLYKAKKLHPDSLIYTITSTADFRTLRAEVEDIRKKLAEAEAYDLAKRLSELRNILDKKSVLQVTDPEIYNPKNKAEPMIKKP